MSCDCLPCDCSRYFEKLAKYEMHLVNDTIHDAQEVKDMVMHYYKTLQLNNKRTCIENEFPACIKSGLRELWKEGKRTNRLCNNLMQFNEKLSGQTDRKIGSISQMNLTTYRKERAGMKKLKKKMSGLCKRIDFTKVNHTDFC